MVTGNPMWSFSDYRLDNGRTGLEVLQQCRLRGRFAEGVIISADRTDDMLAAIKANSFSFIAKPVKPLKTQSSVESCELI